MAHGASIQWKTSEENPIARTVLTKVEQKKSDLRELAQYLYRIQPIRDGMLTKGATEEEKRIVSEHFSYLQSLQSNGILILAGRTQNIDNSSHGIVIFTTDSEENARKIVLADPAVEKKVFRAELFPYHVSLLSEKNAQQEAE